MDNKTLEILIKNECEKVFEKYNEIFKGNEIDFSKIKYKFNLKGRVAGRAWYVGKELSFNLFYAKDNLLSFINDTIPHEIAHLYQKKLYPFSKPHGIEWKQVMIIGGYNPVRCHHYNSQSLPQKTKKIREIFEYSCKCGMPHKLTKNRHSRFQNGTSNYICTKCRSSLYFVKRWVEEGI